jgi:hypothetical protein
METVTAVIVKMVGDGIVVVEGNFPLEGETYERRREKQK